MKKEYPTRQSKERAPDASEAQMFSLGWSLPDSYYDLKSCDSWALSCLYTHPENTRKDSRSMMFIDKNMPRDALEDDLLENAGFASEEQLQTKSDILAWAAESLTISPAARLMLKEAAGLGWGIGLEDLQGPDFHIDVPEKLIVLSSQGLSEAALGRSPYFCNMLLVSFIRALRDVWQEKRYGAFDEDYAPEAVLTLERVRAADLDVISVLVAWELRSEDQGDLWRYMIGSEEGDLAMRFSGFLEREPSAHFTHKALAATFMQWFRREERVDACDHETLNYLDTIIDSGEYNQQFGNKKLTAIAVERLSCLPDKTAYLQGRGAEIISSPLYAGMNDEINQAHLMHILHDMRVTYAQGVPFRNAALAAKIFPNGMMTAESEDIHG